MNPAEYVVCKPILPASDLSTSVAFYRTLGFEVVSYDDGYAWVLHGGTEIFHLRAVDEAPVNAAAYLHVQNVDDWHRGWTETDIEIGPLADQPWAMREFAVRDPAGNLLRVGQNL